MPFVRVELAVLSIHDGALKVLLGKRTQAPHAGKWALPGGVLRIDLDQDLAATAQRVAMERLGVALPGCTQLCTVGHKDGDPRAPWAMSVVYRSLLQTESINATPGKRLEALRWVRADDAMRDASLAFDHANLIRQAVAVTRLEVKALQFQPGLLPQPFTLAELQAAAEVVLGTKLDKSSFRRRLDDAGAVAAVPGAMRTGAFRPAQLYEVAEFRAEA